jgi:hypothetical protein
MKHTVRLQRGLYVLMDSYAKPNFFIRFRQFLPLGLCIFSITVAAATLHIVEQRGITACQSTHRASF